VGRWTFGVAILLVLAVQLWMVYTKAKEANSPSAAGILVCVCELVVYIIS
jgi:hypothetical protein